MLHRTLTALIVVLLSACATTGPGREEIAFEPVKLVNEPTGPDGFEIYDAQTLFDRGIDLMRGGEHQAAIAYFARIPDEFPGSSLVIPSWFNQAVCWIRLEDGERALTTIDKYLALLPEGIHEAFVFDGQFKRGAALMLLERHEEAAEVFDILIVETSKAPDKIEALVDSGVAHFMLEDRVTSEYRFLKALRFYKAASKHERIAMKYFIAQAQFYLAEIARMEFSDFELRYPTAAEVAEDPTMEGAMGKNLEQKCQLLLRAQYAFTRTVREGHPGWASAAGYKVGTMYEELYNDLVNLPEPDDLTDDQKKLFKEFLRDRVLILLEKAVKVWGATAEMAQRTGQQNLWVDKTQASLDRVREYVIAQNATKKKTEETS